MTLLVLLEHERGDLVEAAREALTAARSLADDLSLDVEAVAIGEGGDKVVAEAGRYGAATVHLVTDDLLTDYGPDAWAVSLGRLAEEADAEVVMSVGTDRGNEVLAQMAARSDLPFVANCLSFETGGAADEDWTVTRVQWGGSLLEDVTLSADRKLVTVGHHAVAAVEADDPSEPEVETFEPELDESVTVTMITDRDVLTQGITLATAPVVVSGGRGVGSADGFAPLDELAELLGGVVGCSRAVTNNGWRPHTDQVGQTGTRIAPDVYIATGISGAIQHWVGAMASKKIVAINTDPEANMVSKADYAVLADLHKLVPLISAEIRRRRQG
ncbi:MAG: electron transfer flavoprotein subunit alpha/FixB family protein [Actinomycetota bacterium]